MKRKAPTIDAQQMKRALQLTIKKIGRRKRIGIGQWFELVVSCVNDDRAS
jgi:hypothetical protein